MMKKFIKLGLLALVTGTTLLTGCGKEKKEVKDTLVFAQLSDPKTLDPQNSTDQYSQNAIAQIYDRLFEINEDTGEPILSLAKSFKREGVNTLVIKLKEKVKFHNGDFLTAEDIKFTIERAKSNPRVAHLYKLIEKIEIINDHEIKVITSEAFAPLMNHLSHKSASILNKEVYDKIGEKAYLENPIGTGAYKMKSWDMGDRMVLEAVPGYFKGDAKIKTIVMKGVPEENSKVIGLETGELDMVLDVPAIAWENIEKSDNMQIETKASTTTGYLGLNTNKGILKDKDIRKAVAMAINKDAIIETVFLGKVTRAEQMLAPPIFGHDKNIKALSFNPEKAREIVKEKGLEGEELKIVVSSPERVQMATIIQDQLKNIGLNLKIELIEWGTFLAETGAGNVDMFIMGWGPSTYDGDYGYYPNIHSDQRGSDGNRTFYSNEKVDRLLEMARSELNVETRKNYYKEITQIIIEENPIIPLYHNNAVFGISKKLKNVKAAGYPEFYKYEYMN